MRPRRPPPPPDAPTEVGPAAPVVEEGVPPVVEDRYVPPRRPPLPELWPWLLALLLLVVGGLVAWYFLSRGNGHHRRAHTTPVAVAKVAVPRVIGLKESAAAAKLGRTGLVPRPVFHTSRFATGTVFGQDPAQGSRIPRRSSVTLVVSSGTAGRAQVLVPDVTGLPQANAEATLRGAGLAPVSAQVASAQPRGVVVAQSPRAGTKVARGARVRLNVSSGPTSTGPSPKPPAAPARVKVPNVVGNDQTTAQRRLQRAGLASTVAYVASSKPAGTVVAERPVAGTLVKRGSRIALSVSSGPNPKPLRTVPDVTGEDAQTATTTLRQAGFRVVAIDQPTSDPSEDGIVLDEQPAAGSRIPAGSQVTIYVGVFSG